jgi:NADH dehydrogenase FAD-containing subunit
MLDDLLLEDINTANRMMLLEMLNKSGVASMTSAKVLEITEKGVVVDTNRTKKEVAGDSIVLAAGLTSQSQLRESLKDSQFEVFAIGDCVKPRKILNAIWEGFNTSRLI